jgi:hypothetical protein
MGKKQRVLTKEGNFFELLPMRDDNYGNGCQELQYILIELLCVRHLNCSNERGEQVEQNVRGTVGWLLLIYLFVHCFIDSLIHSFKDCVMTSVAQTVCLQRRNVILKQTMNSINAN